MNEKARVLIVDDTVTNIAILSACLENDYELLTARRGDDCLQLANQSPKPDLILLDIEMPGISGYQVCQQLKSSSATVDIPIIFVTGKLDVKDEEKGFSLGAVDYITKPIHPPLVAARVKTHITLKKQKDALEKMALFDQLTGIYNRHYLLNSAKISVAYSIRHSHPISVLMIDIDHFKSVNDEHGHPAGDSVIRAVAKILDKEFRDEDVSARFGGEEFVVLLNCCDLDNAQKRAEAFRIKIEKLKPLGIDLTVSIGVSQLENDEQAFSDLLALADKRLYLAKQQGRNKVVACE